MMAVGVETLSPRSLCGSRAPKAKLRVDRKHNSGLSGCRESWIEAKEAEGDRWCPDQAQTVRGERGSQSLRE
jgi:hypothetical protein